LTISFLSAMLWFIPLFNVKADALSDEGLSIHFLLENDRFSSFLNKIWVFSD
jgi:hypothetical protein